MSLNYRIFKKLIVIPLLLIIFFNLNIAKSKAFSISPNGLEKEANPGEIIEVSLNITNDEREPQKFYIKPVNLIMEGEHGEQKFIPAGQGGDLELAEWIELTEPEFELNTQQEKKYKYKINIPEDASSGGHYGGIIILKKDPQTLDNIGTTGGIVFLNFIKIPGNIKEDIKATFEVSEPREFYTEIPSEYKVNIKNVGNIHLMPVGNVYIENHFNKNVDTVNLNPDYKIILPLNTRILEIDKKNSDKTTQVNKDEKIKSFFQTAYNQLKDFQFGKYTISAKIIYGENQDKLKVATQEIWIIPWQLFSIIAVTLLITLIIIIAILIIIKRTRTPKDPTPTDLQNTPPVNQIQQL